VDADRLTRRRLRRRSKSPLSAKAATLCFTAATTAEERVGRRIGVRTVRIGLRGAAGLPDGELVSFGLAGALADELQVGDVLDATRVVDATGATLWEGTGLGVRGAKPGTVLASDVLVHDAAERRRLRAASGADAVDMESGVLARSGRLAGVVRAISDGVDSDVEGVDRTIRDDGRTDVAGLVRWIATKRGHAVRSMRDAVRALSSLEKALA
jgi:adenosylhomocysteine nucleosidase